MTASWCSQSELVLVDITPVGRISLRTSKPALGVSQKNRALTDSNALTATAETLRGLPRLRMW